MKSIVIYFSQTGSTKKVAQAIYKGLQAKTDQCDFVKLKEVDPSQLKNYDLIALGTPVWGGVPLHVKIFIHNLSSLNGKHIAVFSTHGASPERFFPQVIKLLKKKELIIIGMNDWYGSVFRPTMPKPYFTDGHPDAIDLEEAERFGMEMAEKSQKIYSGQTDLIPELPDQPMPPPSGLPKPQPELLKDKCLYPECALCVDNCPMDDIDLSASPPHFARNCTSCFFCEMICPEGAVKIDYEARTKESLKRIEKLFITHLEKAEAEGRFRKLIPFESIDMNRPYYKVYNTHPRYTIPEE